MMVFKGVDLVFLNDVILASLLDYIRDLFTLSFSDRVESISHGIYLLSSVQPLVHLCTFSEYQLRISCLSIWQSSLLALWS